MAGTIACSTRALRPNPTEKEPFKYCYFTPLFQIELQVFSTQEASLRVAEKSVKFVSHRCPSASFVRTESDIGGSFKSS